MVREGPSEEASLAESWRVVAGGGEAGRGRGVSIWTSPERRRRTVRRSSCLGV